jgi:glutathione peroxidase-family protein
VNYTQLQQIYEKLSESGGLRILGFPCNQFGGQEPGTEAEIKEFVKKFGVTFDMFSKINVNGSGEHPLYTYLKAAQPGMLINAIKWNFTKFCINKEGIAVARFGPADDPVPKVENKVEQLIAK